VREKEVYMLNVWHLHQSMYICVYSSAIAVYICTFLVCLVFSFIKIVDFRMSCFHLSC
jgi:hypothetical protein